MSKAIPLTQGQYAIVDDEDYEWLNQWNWHAAWHARTKSYYAIRTACGEKRTTIRMARQILGAKRSEIVDHWDHNTLNNQRENLRKCTNAQNSSNRRKGSNSTTTSRYKGVSWHSRDCVWQAEIGSDRNGSKVFLGSFEDEQSAARAYDIAAIERWGEFALLNFSDSRTCINIDLCEKSINDNPHHLKRQVKKRGFTSVYTGVCFNKLVGKWMASIRINGKSKYLGLFTDQGSAARAYDVAEIERRGEYAVLNFPVIKDEG